MSSKLVDTVAPMLRRLRGLAQDSPDLKDAVECYETILPLLSSVDLLVEPVSITPEQARAKMERGQPLLDGLELELDGQAISDLMLELAQALETLHGPREQGGPLASVSHELAEAAPDNGRIRAASARKIRLALEENRLDIRVLLPHIVAGEEVQVTSAAQSLDLDPGLVRMLAQSAIKPALRAWCRQLTPMARGVEWHRGYCFICGAGTTFGELQGNEQAKHLRCGKCGADWLFPRLQCAHCGNEDHRTLGYLYPESRREKMSIEVCHRCNGYLKVIATFDPTPPEMLPVEDLMTIHLDYIAQERGYGRLTGMQSRQPCIPFP